MASQKLGNIKPENAIFFLCDIQEKFRPVIKYFKEILEIAEKLVEASTILNIPMVVTEQYPKGLGETVSELKDKMKDGQPRFSKTKFTMLVPEVISQLEANQSIKHVVLFGIETHVCVQQTVIDLLERGYEVHIVADACSSRTQMDRTFAFERFRQSGAIVTTSDAILLQLIGDKDHQHFKAIQKLIMKTAPDSGL
ncbi:isochorismatase domain-containing protein 1-like [Crassostrea virginica]|uniref:Isochorismatase domain-containing protein 1-like n=1 Tax=Crassostrea virginica TaxID=6565 RepID=A0A8B8A4D9_CRAVI|nr:isochorismatase domain-containing protein 1-like [Crassostrea virginica]XP_022338084.1 isochorismatase domain-containing protein 1-like [Crassostrea virginica]